MTQKILMEESWQLMALEEWQKRGEQRIALTRWDGKSRTRGTRAEPTFHVFDMVFF